MFRLQRSTSNASTAKSDLDERGANEVVTLATLDRLPIVSIYTSMGDFGAVKRIVRGRRSEVYTVVCRRSLGHMAVKKYTLGKDSGKVPLMVRLKREICNMDACSGIPFVTKLFGFFREGRGFHLAIELFPFGDLDTIRKMQPGRKLPETYVAICIVRPLLIALNGMHERGIVHGNVIPESIFVKSRNVAYLGDFSSSTNLEVGESFLPGLTPIEYSAPEVVMTIHHLAKKVPTAIQREVYGGRYPKSEVKVDIWAIGCLTYELLVGYSPFSEGPNPAPKDFIQRAVDLGMNILTRDVSTLYFPASISMEVREFIQSCLTVSPLERPTADELLDHDWFLVQAEFELESHNSVMFPSAAQPTGFAQGKYRSSQIRKVSEALRRSSFATGKSRMSFGLGRFSRTSSMHSSTEHDPEETKFGGIAVEVDGRAPIRERGGRQSIDDVEQGLKKDKKVREKEKDDDEGGGRVRFGRIMTLKRQESAKPTDGDGPAGGGRPNGAPKSRLSDVKRPLDKPPAPMRKGADGGLLSIFKKKKVDGPGGNKVTPDDGLSRETGPRLRLVGPAESDGGPKQPKAPAVMPKPALRNRDAGTLAPSKGPVHQLKMQEGGGEAAASSPGPGTSAGPAVFARPPVQAAPSFNSASITRVPAQFKDFLKEGGRPGVAKTNSRAHIPLEAQHLIAGAGPSSSALAPRFGDAGRGTRISGAFTDSAPSVRDAAQSNVTSQTKVSLTGQGRPPGPGEAFPPALVLALQGVERGASGSGGTGTGGQSVHNSAQMLRFAL